MIDRMKKNTMSRILRPDGRVVMVAMDHARMNGVYRGLEDPAPVIEAIIEGGADAIMTSYGVLKHYGHLLDGRIKKVLRLDTGASKFRDNWEEFREWYQVFTVEDAVRIGADAVITYGFPGIDVDGKTLDIIGKVAAEADRLSVPSIAEMHACPCPHIEDPYDKEIVASSSRIASEFGADMIKTDYTGSYESFKYVVDRVPAPIIIAGGRKCDTPKETLQMIKDAVDAGARGCVFGRQIWQDPKPAAITRAIAAIIHGNVSVEEAEAIYHDS